MWLSVPIVLYVLERISRHFGPLNKSVDIVGVVEHPNDVIEIEFMQKDLKAKPGQVTIRFTVFYQTIPLDWDWDLYLYNNTVQSIYVIFLADGGSRYMVV